MLGNNINKLIYFFKLYLFSLIVLFITRVILYFYYFDYFLELTFIELITSLMVGIKIDIMSLNTFIGIFLLLLAIPFKFTLNKYYRYFLGYLWFVVLSIIIFINIADLIYFGFFYKHIDSTLIALNNDIDPIIGFAKAYIFYIIILIFCLLILLKVWSILLKKEVINNSYISLAGIFFVTLIFIAYGARGCKVSGKPFNISDAYVTDKISGANLSISGFYSAYRNSYNMSHKNQVIDFYPKDEAINNIRQILQNLNTKFVDKKYPFKRKFTDDKSIKKYNVSIVLLESFSSKFVDSFNGNIGLNTTPFLDSMANDGIKLTNAYANGRQSIDGVGAVLAGIVAPANNNLYFGKGLEASQFSYLGSIFKNNGYSTIAMQSSKRNSFRVDSIARLSGFDTFYGAEDFQTHQHGEDKNKMPHYGTWDGDMFNRYFKELDTIKKPFLSFAFTSTTHFPYYLPAKKYEIYPQNKKTINGFFNTMRYTDDMIKDFITKAKKTTWFKDTVFIFIADHTAPITIKEILNFEKENNLKIPNRTLEHYKIPFIIYAPYILKPQIIDTVVSQADILPSMLDILGFKNQFSTISNSVFKKDKNSFVFAKAGDIYTFITKDGYTTRRTDKRFIVENKDYSKEILSIHQVFVDNLNKNRFY